MNSRKESLGTVLAVAVLAVVTYGTSLRADFVCDDLPLIVENAGVHSLSNIPELFKTGMWTSSRFEIDDTFLYRPVPLALYAVEHSLWGLNPFAFHLTNVLIHALNCVLLFLVIRRLSATSGTLSAALAAGIFAVHPIHTESVTWISGATDLLATLFCLLSLLCFLLYRESNRLGPLLASLGAFILALLCKEVAIVCPVLIIVCSYLCSGGPERANRRQVGAFTAFFLIAATYMVARRLVLGASMGGLEFSAGRLVAILQFTAGYLRWLVVPWPQPFYYDMPSGGVIGTAMMVVVAVVFLGVAAYALRKKGLFLAGFVWILVSLAPPLLLAFHAEPAFAARFLYLPSVGLSLILVVPISRGVAWNRRATVVAMVVIGLICAGLVLAANQRWEHDGTFYASALEDNPKHFGVADGLASYYYRTNQLELAVVAYLNAANFGTDEQRVDAYVNAAGLYGRQGNLVSSLEIYRKALDIDPECSPAHNGLGNICFANKDLTNAAGYYERAYAYDPTNAEAIYNLAMVYDKLGRHEDAVKHYRIFLETPTRPNLEGAKHKVRVLLGEH